MSNVNLFAGLPLAQSFKPLTLLPSQSAPAAEAGKASQTKDSVSLGGTYTVRKLDTLWGISKQVLGDATRWPEIYKLNQDQIQDPDLIYPGTVLKMPAPLKHQAPEAPSHQKPQEPAKKPSEPAQSKPSEPTKKPSEPVHAKPSEPTNSPTAPTQASKPAAPQAPADPHYPTVGQYVKQRYDAAVDSTVTGLHGAAEIALPPLLLGEIAGIKAKHQEAALRKIWDLPMDPQGKWKVQAQKISDAESAAANAEIKALPGVRALSAAGEAIGDGATWTGQQIKAGANAVVNGAVDAGVAVGRGVQWTGTQISNGAEWVGTQAVEAPKAAARGVLHGIGGVGQDLQKFSQWALGGLGN